MSYSRFIIEVFAFDASLFAREAVRTSLMRSQAAMNFLFVRIYKTANIEYLEKKVKKTLSKCFDHMRNGESDIKRTSQYYLYLIQRERFKQCLRDLFLANSIFLSLTKYIKWRREYDAGLATAWLIYYNYEEANSFWGKSLSQPVIHRFSIIQKLK